MGFFAKPDPIELLKKELEKKPKDSKILLDLAAHFKAKGATDEAVEYYMRAAQALSDVGFAPKAVALVKQVTQLAPKAIEPYELLAKLLEQLKVKEDLRAVLKILVPLYRSNGKDDLARATEEKIKALGPGR